MVSTVALYGFFRFICRHVRSLLFFFLMIRRPPRSTLDRSSAASDVYKRQERKRLQAQLRRTERVAELGTVASGMAHEIGTPMNVILGPVSYTHLRAHETVLDLVCRLLLEKKNSSVTYNSGH